jgi:hypothetical protein
MHNSKDVDKDDLQIVGAMLCDPTAWHFGLAAAGAAGIPAGNAYPSFARLERAEWLESRWDDGPPGAPRRRLYRLTGTGQRLGAAAVADRPRRLPSRTRMRLGFPARRESLA